MKPRSTLMTHPISRRPTGLRQAIPTAPPSLHNCNPSSRKFWKTTNTTVPDYRDFPGLPIRTRTTMTKQSQPTKPGGTALGGATEITTTIISANQNPISDAEFAVLATLRRRSCRTFLIKGYGSVPFAEAITRAACLPGVWCFISAGVRVRPRSNFSRFAL